MDDDLIELLRAGLTLHEAADFLATVRDGYSQAEWAQIRGGVTRQAVSENVRNAKEKLAERKQ